MAQRSLRAMSVTLGLAALLVVWSAPLAFAPHVVRVEVEPAAASPGDEVSVFGPVGYGAQNPVEIHWNDPEGEVLATVETEGGQFYAEFGPVDVTIPEDAASGRNHLVVTQELADGEGHIRGLPAYGPVQVTGGGAPAEEEPATSGQAPGVERVEALSEAQPPSEGLLVLIGLGTLVVALAVAAVGAKALRRNGPKRAPANTTS